MINLRAVAARLMLNVMAGTALDEVLAEQPITHARDQAFVHALCYGVCRWFYRLNAIAKRLLTKPLDKKNEDIYLLILIGLYQLMEMRVLPHAAVAETVAAAETFKKVWAKGLINAVLRRYQRHASHILAQLGDDLESVDAHPAWMIQKIQNDWPNDWQAILTANNQHPPFVLRVNQTKLSRERYIEILHHHFPKLTVQVLPETPAGLVLHPPMDVQLLPGFKQGDVSVQDGAGQLAVSLLDLKPEQRVLDACAAPGGKLTAILESEPRLAEVYAIDQDNNRMKKVMENLERLQLSAHCISADAGEVNVWWDGIPFDRILLDAPCSASGVIRRHPDIKLLRRSTDIQSLTVQQVRLCNALWPLLKPGGLMVYATCSLFLDENVHVMQPFLAKHSDAKEEKILVEWGRECAIGRQILPGMHGMDGFYLVKLRKSKNQ